MARRHEDWNIGLAEDLRDPEFAREFLLGAIDEEVPQAIMTSFAPRLIRKGIISRLNETISSGARPPYGTRAVSAK